MSKTIRPIAGFSIPVDLLEQIDRLSAQEMISRSAFIRRAAAQAVREALKASKAGAA